MAPKRPSPLSDAALTVKGSAASATDCIERPVGPSFAAAADLGEANYTITVKNTFIDLPAVASPNSLDQKQIQPLYTAPAQVYFAPGFIGRSLAANVGPVSEAIPTSDGPHERKVQSSASPGTLTPRRSPGTASVAVQRPGQGREANCAGNTPVMTPSSAGPSSGGSSLFSATRYELFGGPTPVQEATRTAMSQGSGSGRASPAPEVLNGSASSLPPLAALPLLPQDLAAPQASRPSGGFAGSAEKRISARPAEHSDEEDDDEDDSDVEDDGRTAEDAPKPPPGALHPSQGSAAHEEGSCKRCCFFPRNRCLHGYNCEFCHYDHEKRKRKNKKSKKKRPDGQGDETEAREDPRSESPAKPRPWAAAQPQGGDEQLTFKWSDGILGLTPPPPFQSSPFHYPAPGEAPEIIVGPTASMGEWSQHPLSTSAPPLPLLPYYAPLPFGYPPLESVPPWPVPDLHGNEPRLGALAFHGLSTAPIWPPPTASSASASWPYNVAAAAGPPAQATWTPTVYSSTWHGSSTDGLPKLPESLMRPTTVQAETQTEPPPPDCSPKFTLSG